MLNIISRVKLLFRKDKELFFHLRRILGFFPRNIEFYRIAFAHRSQVYRNQKGRSLNNERLEFLGDAILEAVVSDILYHKFDKKREGFLSNTRSKLVSRTTLNELAHETGIDRLVKSNVQQQRSSHNSYVGGNAFEALIGAIYLDQGYEACQKFIGRQIIGKLVDVEDVAQKEVNFKSKLLEYCQKNKTRIEFSLKNVDNSNSNSPVFRTIVYIETQPCGEGKGYSKKESEQEASKESLMRLRRDRNLIARILKSKEERTAMEAVEIVAVPKIDEIEELLKKEAAEKEARRKEKNRERKEGERKPEEKRKPEAERREKPARQEERPARKDEKPARQDENRPPKPRNAPKPAAEPTATDAPQAAAPDARRRTEAKPQPVAERPAADNAIAPSRAPRPAEASAEADIVPVEETRVGEPYAADDLAPTSFETSGDAAERPARNRAPRSRRTGEERKSRPAEAPEPTAPASETADATETSFADADDEIPTPRPARKRPSRRRPQRTAEAAETGAETSGEDIIAAAEAAAYEGVE